MHILALYAVTSKCSWKHLSLINTKHYNYINYIYFETVTFCNYTLLPATVKMLATFLDAILWKHFHLFLRILNNVSSITKAPSLQCGCKSREQVKISWSRIRKVWRMLSVVTLFFANKALTKWDRCAGALSWKTVGSTIFGTFPFDCRPTSYKTAKYLTRAITTWGSFQWLSVRTFRKKWS
jgi:hypothetical protein